MIIAKFYKYNWWNIPIYITKDNKHIAYFDKNFYSLTDDKDIDSDPYLIIKDTVKIVDNF